MHEVQGVVARAKGEPVTIETINVPDPGPGEALVQVQACGVCHTDLHYREGGINDDFPFLLGHEAAGVVESVGEGVTDVPSGRSSRQFPSPKSGSEAKAYGIVGASPAGSPLVGNGVVPGTALTCATRSSCVCGRDAAYAVPGADSSERATRAADHGRDRNGVMVLRPPGSVESCRFPPGTGSRPGTACS